MSIRGKAVIVGALRAPAPRDPRPHGRPDPPRGGRGRAGRRRAHPRRRRRLLLRLDRTGVRTGVDGGVPRPGGALRRHHRDGRQLVPRSTSATPRRPSRPASAGWRSSRWPAGRAPAGPRPAAPSAWPTAPRPGFEQVGHHRARWATTPCRRAATCTSSAPPASSWRGSRSRRRSTPSTTRTRCCPNVGHGRRRARLADGRRSRSTGSTAAWSPTAAARWWSCTRTWRGTSAAPVRRCSATARPSSTATPAASTSPTRRPGGAGRRPSRRPA